MSNDFYSSKLHVYIERSARSSVTLTVTDASTLVVKAPNDFPKPEIDRIIESKRQWIDERRRKFESQTSEYSQLYMFRQVMMFGKLIDIEPSPEARTYMTEKLYVPHTLYGNFDKRRSEVLKEIKRAAQANLPMLISIVGTKMGVCPSGIEIQAIRGSRVWGKCFDNGKIVIDIHTVQLPVDLQTFIVVHEFCHLTELNHSREFHNLIEQYLPNYRELRKRLEDYAFLRELY